MSGLSLLVCAASASVWVRGCGRVDQLCWNNAKDGVATMALAGGGQFIWYRDSDDSIGSSENNHKAFSWLHHREDFRFDNVMRCYCRQVSYRHATHYCEGMGFFITWGILPPPDDDVTRQAVIVPVGILFSITLPLPLIWLSIRFAKRGFPPGCCTACGYDLRASKDCCPECGRAIEKNRSPDSTPAPAVSEKSARPGTTFD
jgi:hypothetical protein